MSLFTGMAILEERFSTAYFRFNDNTAADLQPGLRAPEDAEGFVTRWDETARNLAQVRRHEIAGNFQRHASRARAERPPRIHHARGRRIQQIACCMPGCKETS